MSAEQRTPSRPDHEVIKLVEEFAVVTKKQVEDGRIRVSTTTDVVQDHRQEILESEHVEVTRVAIGTILAAGEALPMVRTEGDLTIVPVLEEIVIVEKRMMLKEELHLRRSTTSESVAVPVSLRKQRATFERIPQDFDESESRSGGIDGTT